ncbi:hypothetical protein Bca101_002484 [Brassica carinata]
MGIEMHTSPCSIKGYGDRNIMESLCSPMNENQSVLHETNHIAFSVWHRWKNKLRSRYILWSSLETRHVGAMSKHGKVKSLRLVRHIVTGASRGYAFVEYETEKEMRRAYEDAHHSFIDGREIIVDYNRQQLMPGWIPRRLGGGLGGRKESGQLRFGGRERPFRAPLRPIPHEDLKKLGIQLPPEGRYMSRTQIPSPPRRKGCVSDREEGYYYRGEERSPVKREGSYHSHRESESAHRRHNNKDKEERSRIESRSDRKERSRGIEDRYGDKQDVSGSKRSNHGEERPHKRHKHRRPHHHRRSSSRDHHHSSDLDT